ncbi:MAG: hypothetical protein M1813_009175 [Trichoglossum hirsutum]|nr:MAG: hypothetical protein M1813_009175 [Trichoglossum hirsutum]
MAEPDHSMTILIMTAQDVDATIALESSNFQAIVSSFYENSIEATSREPTPCVPVSNLIQLYFFDMEPKDPSRGFVFGSNEKVCDVLLDISNARGINPQHLESPPSLSLTHVTVLDDKAHMSDQVVKLVKLDKRILIGANTDCRYFR